MSLAACTFCAYVLSVCPQYTKLWNLERAELNRSLLKIRLWWFLPRKKVCLVGKAFSELFKGIQDKAIISISLVWAVTKDAVPVKTTLPVTFHSLILCSNLGNCLNHRELIPVMPLPPPPRSCIGPMHRTTSPDSLWIPAKPNDFQVPRPLLLSVCLHSQNGPVFCLHTRYSCQIVADLGPFFISTLTDNVKIKSFSFLNNVQPIYENVHINLQMYEVIPGFKM